jgi:tetratricopeptide (TPR) repeat protein
MADLFDKALAAHREGDLPTAARLYQASLKRRPGDASHNLGVVYRSLGRVDEAERYFRAALRISPNFARSRHSLGMIRLSKGDYSEGWPLYEARRLIPGSTTNNPPDHWPTLRCPEWTGGDLRGKRVLVFGEQGLGDMIMFGRFLPALEAMGATVTYVVDPSLTRMFSGSIPGLTTQALPEADFWALVGSLSYRLGVTLENLPPPARIDVPARSGAGIGVMVTGNPLYVNDAARRLTDDQAAGLLALGRDLSPKATGARDFKDTADIIAGLALVITVDTSVAHLAGSMGKPVWILVPAASTDWRWLRDRTDSPWYPSARLFRQQTPGDWSSVLADVDAALA